jgi:hypothetical protein
MARTLAAGSGLARVVRRGQSPQSAALTGMREGGRGVKARRIAWQAQIEAIAGDVENHHRGRRHVLTDPGGLCRGDARGHGRATWAQWPATRSRARFALETGCRGRGWSMAGVGSRARAQRANHRTNAAGGATGDVGTPWRSPRVVSSSHRRSLGVPGLGPRILRARQPRATISTTALRASGQKARLEAREGFAVCCEPLTSSTRQANAWGGRLARTRTLGAIARGRFRATPLLPLWLQIPPWDALELGGNCAY